MSNPATVGIETFGFSVLDRPPLTAQLLLSIRDETEDVIVKLKDFELSIFVEDEKAPSTYVGTKQYMAPVILLPNLYCRS